MRYEQAKMLSKEKLQRLIGIKRITFNTMIEISSTEMRAKRQKEVEKIN